MIFFPPGSSQNIRSEKKKRKPHGTPLNNRDYSVEGHEGDRA